ncbi:type IV pilin-like G/H family protein [Argonema antarcticum A004/B2]|nr:type IV pilin-like G/H family protein [Argonema antarcticum]MCL1471617.1 type IV pilin-like G/H family protein [Argonema antarcticum A004/B2]
MYSYLEKRFSGNNVSGSHVAQSNIIGSPAFSTETEPVKLSSEEEDKEQIPSNKLSPVLQIGKAGESEAKDLIALINRTQKGFFSENGRFASTWSDLGFQVKSKDKDYEYKISWSDRAKTIVIAIAKKPGLKSYSGVVVVEGETAIDKICATNEASDTPPVLAEVTGKDIECPSMSSSISGDS